MVSFVKSSMQSYRSILFFLGWKYFSNSFLSAGIFGSIKSLTALLYIYSSLNPYHLLIFGSNFNRFLVKNILVASLKSFVCPPSIYFALASLTITSINSYRFRAFSGFPLLSDFSRETFAATKHLSMVARLVFSSVVFMSKA